MKRTAGVFVIVLGMVILAACASKFDRREVHEKGRQEVVVLHVKLVSGKCLLFDRTPQEIRTQLGAPITWLIAGQCGDSDTIGIDPMFRLQGHPNARIVGPSDLNSSVPARAGNQLTATVLQQLPAGTPDKGAYQFRVKINGKDAEYNSLADEGDFYLCPSWPCGNFKSFY